MFTTPITSPFEYPDDLEDLEIMPYSGKYTETPIQETLQYSEPVMYTEAPTYETAPIPYIQSPQHRIKMLKEKIMENIGQQKRNIIIKCTLMIFSIETFIKYQYSGRTLIGYQQIKIEIKVIMKMIVDKIVHPLHLINHLQKELIIVHKIQMLYKNGNI